MNFKEHLFFLRSNDSTSYYFLSDAAWREDHAPFASQLLKENRAFTSNFTFRKH